MLGVTFPRKSRNVFAQSGPSCRNFILDLNKGVNALGVVLQRRPRPRPSGASVAAFPAHAPGTAILLVYGQHVSAGF